MYNITMDKKSDYIERKPYLAIIAGLVVVIAALGITLIFTNLGRQSAIEAALPTPEISDGIRGEQFGIDKNINEDTIDDYLGRSDSVYRDMRMLKDPGNYEAIGGDAYLSGYVDGFEIVPLPYIINVTGLPEAVGDTYTGPTLFTEDKNGNITANYEESLRILEDLFPKDKNIFLMCGGGGYAGMTKTLLTKLGWDTDKIYNVGAYWSYNGDNNVSVKYQENGTDNYAFWKIPYHSIDFEKLHKTKK